ncbi:MAG: CDP-alcohol phosphatidyltransferase family protein [Gemmatimonadota bacterium]|nr:CDP-alcohol phosphatidyltransferase family protein [Gemmatimonadota bacterium]
MSSSRVMLAFGFIAYTAAPTRIALIGVASVTDVLDGWLARHAGATSRLGALLDPIADRFFALSVVLAYLLGGELTPWQGIAIMFRDVMSVVGFFVASSVSWLRPIKFMARPLGKIVTVAQILVFLAVLLRPGWVYALVVLVALLGVLATADYTLMLWRERTPKRLRV